MSKNGDIFISHRFSEVKNLHNKNIHKPFKFRYQKNKASVYTFGVKYESVGDRNNAKKDMKIMSRQDIQKFLKSRKNHNNFQLISMDPMCFNVIFGSVEHNSSRNENGQQNISFDENEARFLTNSSSTKHMSDVETDLTFGRQETIIKNNFFTFNFVAHYLKQFLRSRKFFKRTDGPGNFV